MKSYNSSEESKFIMYLDANNSYALAISIFNINSILDCCLLIQTV